jgi:putative FmdB family regulatory protein
MPLYDYKCTRCGAVSEIRHGFDETHGEPCPACGGPLVRVFNPAPIVFKGSGFYVTDSRKPAAAAKPDAPAATPKPAEAPAAGAASTPTPKKDAKPSDSAA